MLRPTSMKYRFALPFLFACFACAASAACSTAPEYPVVGNGAIANGTFGYECLGQADAFCTEPANPALVPTGIALGTTFRMAFTPPADEGEARLDLLGTTQLTLAPDGVVHADKSGYASIFALAADGRVIDFVDLRVVVPSDLRVIGLDPATTLQVGDARSIHAQPIDQGGAVLAGTGTYDWETSDSNVVTVETSSVGFASLRAIHPGVARIRVIFGSATTTVDVLVGER